MPIPFYYHQMTHLSPYLEDVEVHPHVALFATRGKASPCLKEVFQPCFMADSKEVFQPCFMADFKEQMFL